MNPALLLVTFTATILHGDSAVLKQTTSSPINNPANYFEYYNEQHTSPDIIYFSEPFKYNEEYVGLESKSPFDWKTTTATMQGKVNIEKPIVEHNGDSISFEQHKSYENKATTNKQETHVKENIGGDRLPSFYAGDYAADKSQQFFNTQMNGAGFTNLQSAGLYDKNIWTPIKQNERMQPFFQPFMFGDGLTNFQSSESFDKKQSTNRRQQEIFGTQIVQPTLYEQAFTNFQTSGAYGNQKFTTSNQQGFPVGTQLVFQPTLYDEMSTAKKATTNNQQTLVMGNSAGDFQAASNAEDYRRQQSTASFDKKKSTDNKLPGKLVARHPTFIDHYKELTNSQSEDTKKSPDNIVQERLAARHPTLQRIVPNKEGTNDQSSGSNDKKKSPGNKVQERLAARHPTLQRIVPNTEDTNDQSSGSTNNSPNKLQEHFVAKHPTLQHIVQNVEVTDDQSIGSKQKDKKKPQNNQMQGYLAPRPPTLRPTAPTSYQEVLVEDSHTVNLESVNNAEDYADYLLQQFYDKKTPTNQEETLVEDDHTADVGTVANAEDYADYLLQQFYDKKTPTNQYEVLVEDDQTMNHGSVMSAEDYAEYLLQQFYDKKTTTNQQETSLVEDSHTVDDAYVMSAEDYADYLLQQFYDKKTTTDQQETSLVENSHTVDHGSVMNAEDYADYLLQQFYDKKTTTNQQETLVEDSHTVDQGSVMNAEDYADYLLQQFYDKKTPTNQQETLLVEESHTVDDAYVMSAEDYADYLLQQFYDKKTSPNQQDTSLVEDIHTVDDASVMNAEEYADYLLQQFYNNKASTNQQEVLVEDDQTMDLASVYNAEGYADYLLQQFYDQKAGATKQQGTIKTGNDKFTNTQSAGSSAKKSAAGTQQGLLVDRQPIVQPIVFEQESTHSQSSESYDKKKFGTNNSGYLVGTKPLLQPITQGQANTKATTNKQQDYFGNLGMSNIKFQQNGAYDDFTPNTQINFFEKYPEFGQIAHGYQNNAMNQFYFDRQGSRSGNQEYFIGMSPFIQQGYSVETFPKPKLNIKIATEPSSFVHKESFSTSSEQNSQRVVAKGPASYEYLTSFGNPIVPPQGQQKANIKKRSINHNQYKAKPRSQERFSTAYSGKPIVQYPTKKQQIPAYKKGNSSPYPVVLLGRANIPQYQPAVVRKPIVWPYAPVRPSKLYYNPYRLSGDDFAEEILRQRLLNKYNKRWYY